MKSKAKEVYIKKSASKLEELLRHVCSDGYVRYRGQWYRGRCTNPQEMDCSKCDFAGCDTL
jgi:hypothetical protein